MSGIDGRRRGWYRYGMTEPTPTAPQISSDLAETLASMHKAVPEWDADEVWCRIRDAERDYGAHEALEAACAKILDVARRRAPGEQAEWEKFVLELRRSDPREANMDKVYAAYLSALHAAITSQGYAQEGSVLQQAGAALAVLDVHNTNTGHMSPRTRKGVYEAAVKLVRS